jgi:hypothetical protein
MQDVIDLNSSIQIIEVIPIKDTTLMKSEGSLEHDI